MLANDSNEGKSQSEFVIRLELAWQLDVVSCSECNRGMRLDEDDLDGFRERLKDATARVEALKNGPPK